MADASALKQRVIDGANNVMRIVSEQALNELVDAWNGVTKTHTGDPHLPDTRFANQVSDSPRIQWRIGFTAPQGEWLEHGTQPHSIFPREPGGVLHWTDEAGEDVFAKYVHNNFIEARPWFSVRLREVWPGIVAENLDAAGW